MKKNVLISIYDMEIGGIERSLISLLESFDYHQYNVDLFIFNHAGDFMNLIPSKVNILPQIDKYTVFRKPIIQCIREGHYSTSIVRILCKLIASVKSNLRGLQEGSGYIQMQLVLKYLSYLMPKIQKKYELGISYAWPHDIMISKVDANKKIAWIHTDYSQLEIDNELDFHIWNKFDYIASISDACTNSFLTKYPSLKDKIVGIENITSPYFIKKMSNDMNSLEEKNDESFNVLSVGRLSYTKGFDMAIEALRALHDKGFTNIKWYVIGYGSYEDTLRQLITKYNLKDSFVLLGKKTNPYPYIKACDLYVQPSRYEGKAITVTEAQILGKPVVITNFPTAKSQLEDGFDGHICPMDVDGIVEGITRMFEDVDFRNKIANNSCQRSYSNEAEVKKLYQIIG